MQLVVVSPDPFVLGYHAGYRFGHLTLEQLHQQPQVGHCYYQDHPTQQEHYICEKVHAIAATIPYTRHRRTTP